jgi:hypothetical protein
MKPTTDDTIQAFRCKKKAIRSIENVQKNIKAPHIASSNETPTLALKFLLSNEFRDEKYAYSFHSSEGVQLK